MMNEMNQDRYEYEQNDYHEPQPEPQPILQPEQMMGSGAQSQPVMKETKKKGPKKEHKFLKSAVAGLIFGVCAGAVFLGFAYAGSKLNQKESEQKEVVLESTASIEKEQSDGNAEEYSMGMVSQIAKNCMPSVVAITTKNVDEVRSFWGTQKYESEGAGSGIIVGKSENELLVATNNHVVSGATEVSVCFNDSEDAVVKAKVKGSDASKDLAVVAIPLTEISDEILTQIKVAVIGDSANLSVGDQVVAIGNALGYGQSVTTGIVSALDREVEIEDLDAKLIQTDAAINPGNSGGALLNMKGELIGINSAKFASATVEGMGYAIPIATAQPILDMLMNRETRELAGEEGGYLGVSVQDVSEEAAQHYGIPKGAYVNEAEKGGAADVAGIKQGDIITKFDGITITSSSELSQMMAYYRKGEQVEVVYMRANNGVYEETTVTVTLAESKMIKENETSQNESQEEEMPKSEEIPEGEIPYGGEYSMPGNNMDEIFRYFFGN